MPHPPRSGGDGLMAVRCDARYRDHRLYWVQPCVHHLGHRGPHHTAGLVGQGPRIAWDREGYSPPSGAVSGFWHGDMVGVQWGGGQATRITRPTVHLRGMAKEYRAPIIAGVGVVSG